MDSNGTASKAVSAPSSPQKNALVEIKNNKVIFRQKAMALDKLSETLQEIVQFRSMLESRASNGEGSLTSIPVNFRPVVVKLAFESDKTLATLSKHIRQELLPVAEDENAASILPASVVEATIKDSMARTNYGLDPPDGTSKIPASLSIWRWEPKDEHFDWLPPSVRPKAMSRVQERNSAKKALADLLATFSTSEKDALLGLKGTVSKSPMKNASVNDSPIPGTSTQDDADAQTQKLTAKPKKDKVVDPKEIERLERKAAKIEREKKQKAAEDKSRSLMANFFSKPKAAPTPALVTSDIKLGSSSTESDYQRTFKPFVLKKDATLAPSNIFRERPKRSKLACGTSEDAIVLDDEAQEHHPATQFGRHWGLTDIRQWRRAHPHVDLKQESVRDIVTRLSEAEVTGDTSLVRHLLSKLGNRIALPAKVFIFHDDVRPGYFGTRTRTSTAIRPRRPFAKDVLEMDYGYDSGEEWEPEPAGEGDDVVEDDDEDVDGDDQDSDADSWLVDDDDLDEVTAVPEDDMGPLLDLPRPSAAKRKADDAQPNLSKKRKLVVPLVPFAKGPYWEPVIGQCQYAPFNGYRIRFFNDSPVPLDPFKDVVGLPTLSTPATTLAKAKDPIFVVPPVPISANSEAALSTTNLPPPPVPKKSAPAAKTVFPDAHLPTLIGKLSSIQTGSLTFLVEAVHQELKQHKVKKNAIEAKIKEIGEKCKETKQWRLKSEFAGMSQQVMQA